MIFILPQTEAAELAKHFERFASKQACLEATSEDIQRWFRDAGVFDDTEGFTSATVDAAVQFVKAKNKR